MMIKGDVVQFNEKHKWCGCLGFITEIKTIHKKDENGVDELDKRYMVGVPSPEGGIAYIFVMESEEAIELVGHAILLPKDSDENEE